MVDLQLVEMMFVLQIKYSYLNWIIGAGGGVFFSEKLTDPFLPDDVRRFVIQILFILMKIYQRKNKQTIYKTIKFKTNKLMK